MAEQSEAQRRALKILRHLDGKPWPVEDCRTRAGIAQRAAMDAGWLSAHPTSRNRWVLTRAGKAALQETSDD